MLQSSVTAAFQYGLVSPKGTQKEKNTSHQTVAIPYGEPQGSSGFEKQDAGPG